MESESLMAIKELNNGPFSSFPWLSIVEDILDLKFVCGVRVFSFIPKAANMLVHDIAIAHSL